MKKICISILLILTCFNPLFAPSLDNYLMEQQRQEKGIIIKLNDVLTKDLKDYTEFVKYTEYSKPSLQKAIKKILTIKAIGLTETGMSMLAYNSLTVQQKVDKAYNESEEAAGLLQIRPIMHKHLTRVLKICDYNINDRWKADKSIRMFIVFQNYYNPDWNLERVSRDWNGGGGLGMGKTTTIKYYNKFYTNYRMLKNKYNVENCI